MHKIISPMRLLSFCLFVSLFVFSCKEKNNTIANNKWESKQVPAEDYFLLRAYPAKSFPLKAYFKSMEKAAQAAKQKNNTTGFDTDWILRGPGNAGARANTMVVHPIDENIIYAGFSSGGIFKTTDGGTTWLPIFDDQPYLAIGDIILDPNNPDHVYVGTGDPNISAYPFIGNGVYKSEDAGQTWANIGLTNMGIISKLAIDPTDSNTIYASSMGLPTEKNNDRGLYKSTDGGTNWIQVLFISDQAGIIDFLLDPVDPQILYAAAFERIRTSTESIAGGLSSKIHKSIDGGATWTQLAGGLPTDVKQCRIGLAMSQQDHNSVFAIFVDSTFHLGGIYKTINAGTSWTEIPTDPSTGIGNNALGGFGWYFGKIRVHPTNDDRIMILGTRLLHTYNAGQNWSYATPLSGTGIPHPDLHDYVVASSGDQYICTDGGLYKKAFGTSTWIDIENIPTTQFYRIAYNPNNPDLYAGGAQDNGTQFGITGEPDNWEMVFGNDGFQPVFHPTDSNIFYVETQKGNIWKTTNAGLSFFHAGGNINNDSQRHWDMPYIMSSHDPSVLYAGTYRVYKTETGGSPGWQTISGDLTDSVYVNHPNFHTITTLGESPINANILYVGTTDGNVSRTLDGGNTWANVSQGLPDRYVTSVVASPSFENTLFSANSGYFDNEYIPHLHRSDNNGDDWTDISSNLPQLAINDLFVLPNNNDNVIFVGTDGGVYASLNGGQFWERLGENMPMVAVYDLDYNVEKNELVAGTHGRSIFSFPLDSINVSLNPSTVTISGQIAREDGLVVENAQIFSETGTTMTNENGAFNLIENLPISNCEIHVEKNTNPSNGITGFDLVLLQQHILDIQTLDSPYKLIAADVNQSETITGFDLVVMRQMILAIIDEFPNNESWRFVPSDFDFDNPMNPFDPIYSQTINCNDNVEDYSDLDFIGVKIGDLNLDANPSSFVFNAAARDDVDPLVLQIKDQVLEKGQEYSVDVQVKKFNELVAFQFSLEFNEEHVVFVGVNNFLHSSEIQVAENNFGLNQKEKGVLTFCWNDITAQIVANNSSIFTLRFKALSNGKLSDWLKINETPTPSVAFEMTGKKKEVQLVFKELEYLKSPMELQTISPNPFHNFTIIDVKTVENSLATLTVFDQSGKIVFTNKIQLKKGNNEIIISKEDLKGRTGYFWFQLHANGQTVNGKVILID